MSWDARERVDLHRLLRDAADAAAVDGTPPEGGDDAALNEPFALTHAAAGAERIEHERVIELGVTGFIVRIPENPVLLSAISRVVGWRPNPGGSHHVPCTLKAITGLLAFAEMYDVEMTDGADAMVRQLIRDSYRSRHAAPPAPVASATATAVPVPASARKTSRASLAQRLERVETFVEELVAPQIAWARRHWRPLAVAVLAVYIASPRMEIVREAERSYLEPARLGANASVTTVLGALQRCEGATIAPGSPPPPGCDATVATRPAYERVSVGFANPVMRLFNWDTVTGLRGFAFCDQTRPIEECWTR